VRFEILAGDVVIGWSELESGDPPMGVALGRVHVAPAYGAAPPATGLRVRPEGEPFFEPSGGVSITDYRDELGDDAVEVSLLGLDAETYARWFPHHVSAYHEQFKPRGD
jgi:hypothetical protein